MDEAWDGPAEEARISNDAGESTLRRMYAWRDPDKDADEKAAYKLPHHKVVDGSPGPANLAGVRNALSRLPQSDIPEADHDAVRRHLENHQPEEDSSALGPADELRLRSRAWAICVEAKPVLAGLASGRLSFDEARVRAGQEQARASRGPRSTGGVAVLPLRGLITPHASLLSLLFGGGGGLDSFRASLREAVGSDEISSILIDVDSPGGLTDLLPETAADIRQAREAKPVTAIANTMAGSAAYWLASQADELVVTPSGDVGSIGVLAVHDDFSGMNERIGIDPTYVYAGRYKAELNPDEPLSDEAQAALQQTIDDFYALFVDDVAAGRGVSAETVRSDYGEGRMVTARRAVDAGMADRVATLEEVVSGLAGSRSARGAGAQTMKLSDQLASVTQDVEQVTGRLAEVMARRAEKGKGLGERSRAAAERLEPALTALREVVASAGETDQSSDGWSEGLEIEDSLIRRRV